VLAFALQDYTKVEQAAKIALWGFIARARSLMTVDMPALLERRRWPTKPQLRQHVFAWKVTIVSMVLASSARLVDIKTQFPTMVYVLGFAQTSL
jgi:hypothetical protein